MESNLPVWPTGSVGNEGELAQLSAEAAENLISTDRNIFSSSART